MPTRLHHNPAGGPPAPGVITLSPHHPHVGGHRCGADRGHTAAEAVEAYRQWLRENPAAVDGLRAEFAGHHVACRCRRGQPCVGDLVVAVAGGEKP